VSDELVLGIDIGTASSKAVLVSANGRIVARAQRPHALSLPRPGWAEHDADEVWWSDVRALCAELLPRAGGLKAVCVSGIGPCLLPCDRNLAPLRPAILYGIDARASAEIEELDRRYGPEVMLARGGSTLSAQAVGPKLLWLRRQEPEVWAQTAGWYMAHSFVIARLTGEYVLDHHSASQCDPLYDLDAGGWATDWVEEIAPGVPLPRLAWPAEIVGSVTHAGEKLSGIPEGTAVAAGTIDAWAEAFSAGVRHAGDLMIMYGSTMFFVRAVEGSPRAPELWCTQGVAPGTRTLAAGMSTAGTLTEWVRSLVGEPPWAELVAEAMRVPPGSDGLLMLPYFAGERTPIFDPDARGVVAGLTLAHGRGHLLRAAYEGIALGAGQIVALLEGVAGSARRAVAVGGGLLGPLWPQIVTDVSGLEQVIPAETTGACYGDALLAAIGAGLVPADTDWAVPAELLRPRPEAYAFYRELAALYRDLYPATAAISHALGGLARRTHETSRDGCPAGAPRRSA
jgi:xylulokinase